MSFVSKIVISYELFHGKIHSFKWDILNNIYDRNFESLVQNIIFAVNLQKISAFNYLQKFMQMKLLLVKYTLIFIFNRILKN